MAIETRYELTDSHVAEVCDMLQAAWPENNRTLEQVRSIVAGSDIVLGLIDTETGETIGFGRVLTDFVSKALINYIVVKESHRGQGLGKRIVQELSNHTALEPVDTIELYCCDGLIPFYKSWGFTDDIDMRLMRLEQ